LTAEAHLQQLVAGEVRYPNSTADATRIIDRCRRFTPGRKFLDIGAGYGFFSNEAGRRDFAVTALEPSPRCRAVFQVLNGFLPEPRMLGPDFVESHPAEFDAVLMSQVLEHVDELDECVSSLFRLTRPGGVVAIAVPHFASLITRIQGRGDMFINPPEHLNFFTRSGLTRLFGRHELQPLQFENISRLPTDKITRRIPGRPLKSVCKSMINLCLKTTDLLRRGLYLNAYFRKSEKK
jgi:SAM-dependent methyltransferase